MELIIGLIIGIAIGFFWGVWRATQSFIQRIVEQPEEIKEMMSRVEKLTREDIASKSSQSEENTESIRVEFIGDVCYLYDHADTFLAQGATTTEAIQAAEQRFPGMKFTFRLNESKESPQ